MLYNVHMDITFIDGENTKGRIRDVFVKYKLPVPDWSTYDFKGLFDEAFRLHQYQTVVSFVPYQNITPIFSKNQKRFCSLTEILADT